MKKLFFVMIALLIWSSSVFWFTQQEQVVDSYISKALQKHDASTQATILRNASTKLTSLIQILPSSDSKKPLLQLILNVINYRLDLNTINSVQNVVNVVVVDQDSTNNQPWSWISLNEHQKSLFDAINNTRKLNWLQELSINQTLLTIAQDHIDEWVNWALSHTNKAWDNSVSRVEKSWYKFWFVWETLADNASSASVVIQWWLGSQLHKDILLSDEPLEVGIWYVKFSWNNWRWSAVYAKPL